VGLCSPSVKFLCAARSLGVDFTRTVMIGRQRIVPDPTTLQRVFSVHGISQNAEEFLRENRYAEPFFALLGAEKIDSLDCSDYEHASIVHDMNLPIPDGLRERFSAVHDGGTLEHIFNIPLAFKNCMEMVQIGGHFTQVNNANNFMGHGFWQFSPELLFGAFSAANGYQIEAVLLYEDKPRGAWYKVSNPDEVHSRVLLCNSSPTLILTVAKRVARTAIFTPPPYQTDYVALWHRAANGPPQPDMNASRGNTPPQAGMEPIRWRRFVPAPVKRTLKVILQRLSFHLDRVANQPFDKPYYEPISEDALLRGKLT
jgi:hypothetical protein